MIALLILAFFFVGIPMLIAAISFRSESKRIDRIIHESCQEVLE